MNESHSDPSRYPGVPATEDDLRELLQDAGARPAIPEPDREALEQVARRELERLRRAGATLPRSPWSARRLAQAAGLLLVAAAGWWWIAAPQSPGADVAARVDKVRGSVDWRGDAGILEVGAEVAAGTEIATVAVAGEASLLSLRLAGGESLRLDVGTRLRLESARRIALERGAVYLDSGDGSGPGLEILTPLGAVRDVGTQFEVRLLEGGAALRVRVREGEVSLSGRGQPRQARGGEALTIHVDGGVDRGDVARHGDAWSWVLEAAPTPKIEGMLLSDFVRWVCRETGWTPRYEDADTATAAAEITLHGTIEGLTPGEAVEVVLAGSGLTYRTVGGALVIARARR